MAQLIGSTEINALYDPQQRFGFDANYSVQTKRVATELLVASPELVLPDEVEARRIARIDRPKKPDRI